jgi:hypothetical protein
MIRTPLAVRKITHMPLFSDVAQSQSQSQSQIPVPLALYFWYKYTHKLYKSKPS